MPTHPAVGGLASTRLDLTPGPPVRFGRGTVEEIGPLAAAAAAGRPVLVVTDPGLARTPVLGSVSDSLAAAGCEVAVFDGVVPNPRTDTVAAGVRRAVEVETGAVVAVGGGSSIDTAKGVAVGARNPGRGLALDEAVPLDEPAVPLVAVPTTAGTGAETNAFGVVTDPETGRRTYVGHPSAMPVTAVLDPDLTLGLPPRATAATGMDALVHGVESCLSRRANPWARGLALQAVAMVASHLTVAVADGGDVEARSQLLLAATVAGSAMASTGLGLVHGVAHAVGGRVDAPHGTALCAVLPEVLRSYGPVAVPGLAAVAAALGVEGVGASPERDADAAVERLEALAEAVGQRPRLADLGVGSGHVDGLVRAALEDPVTANSPRPPTAVEVRELLLERL